MQLTNSSSIPFVMQIWLAADNYDYVRGRQGKHYVSATTLLKSPKQIILGDRVRDLDIAKDISDNIAARLGDAIHEGIESAWMNNLPQALKALGQEKLADKFVVNPDKDADLTNKIPVYIEQRVQKEVGDFIVGGKFDFLAAGVLHDFKSTSVWTYIKGSRISEYVKQGSIYRWLNPDRITADFIRICYVFTDWSKSEAIRNPNYPQTRVLAQEYKLLSIEETDRLIKEKLSVLGSHWNEPEEMLPECTNEELWRTETVYKYYAKPDAIRASKVFKDPNEAQAYLNSKKGVGVIVKVEGEPRACGYCACFPICKQRQEYIKE